jgi:hypothetical protein
LNKVTIPGPVVGSVATVVTTIYPEYELCVDAAVPPSKGLLDVQDIKRPLRPKNIKIL